MSKKSSEKPTVAQSGRKKPGDLSQEDLDQAQGGANTADLWLEVFTCPDDAVTGVRSKTRGS